MVCYSSRVWSGLKRTASTLSGIGLAALLGGAPSDAFAKGGRSEHRTAVSRPAPTPVVAIISLNQQRITVYDRDGQVLQSPVSTGKAGYDTPAGIYSVLERKVEHYSNLYDDAAMPFMQRLTWSGIALHAGVLPGHPASAGCVRMPISFAERLFERTKLGMRVMVVRDDISPAEFSHPALFRPLEEDAGLAAGGGSDGAGEAPARVAAVLAAVPAVPASPRRSARAIAAAKAEAAASAAAKAEEARMAARSATIAAAAATRAIRRAEGARFKAEQQRRRAEQIAAGAANGTGESAERARQAQAAAQAAFDEAQTQLERVTAEMQPKVDLAVQLRQQAKEAHAASAAAQEEVKEAARKASPVSVFVSRATRRLYVRQSREQVLETPVTIADPDKPLGTYVFTALGYANGEADLRWSVVSMYRSVNEPSHPADGKRGAHRHAEAAPADMDGARQALDRIAIPKEAVDRISEMVGPGASLIVSDEPTSRETGQATDFIVLMSNEPQGGLKIRRRSPSLEARGRYNRPAYGGPAFGWSGSPFPWWQ